MIFMMPCDIVSRVAEYFIYNFHVPLISRSSFVTYFSIRLPEHIQLWQQFRPSARQEYALEHRLKVAGFYLTAAES